MDGVLYESTILESRNMIRTASAIAFTILYYDYALTFREEVERYWGTRMSSMSLLFFVNRYLSLFAHVPIIVEFYWADSQSAYHQLLSGVTQVVVGVMQLVRTYALYGKSRRILLSLFMLCGAGCLVSAWAVAMAWEAGQTQASRNPSAQTRIAIERGVCDLTMSRIQGQYLAAVWACVLIFDAAVFTLTAVQVLRDGKPWPGGLSARMLRDGAILFVCHLTNILTCLRVYRGVSVTATNIISTSMISRLMLDIRDPRLLDGFCECSFDDDGDGGGGGGGEFDGVVPNLDFAGPMRSLGRGGSWC
ncbi:hypothetical protein PYCCODRAFT_1434103 [Trametes coccinea BRFM310]|uniref:DUF6533 domain-containing protein n=1 Tax=Trametes coccinea (strain BRFM310) TaxID=1353009 RepID=A0A1Y2IU33_TRAC3|nr:hypothetical protein PYCCODRAFT_1434103 [Trametes coccinea BRFM310]